MWGKSTYIILQNTEIYLSIYLVLRSQLVRLRQTDPLLYVYPEQTVPGGEAGHDIRPLQR